MMVLGAGFRRRSITDLSGSVDIDIYVDLQHVWLDCSVGSSFKTLSAAARSPWNETGTNREPHRREARPIRTEPNHAPNRTGTTNPSWDWGANLNLKA